MYDIIQVALFTNSAVSKGYTAFKVGKIPPKDSVHFLTGRIYLIYGKSISHISNKELI
jgi:hypothetical protein